MSKLANRFEGLCRDFGKAFLAEVMRDGCDVTEPFEVPLRQICVMKTEDTDRVEEVVDALGGSPESCLGEDAYVCIKEIVTRACEVYDKHKNIDYYLTRNMEAVWMHIAKRNVFILCCYNYDIPAFLPVRLQEHIFTARQRLVIYRRFLLRFFYYLARKDMTHFWFPFFETRAIVQFANPMNWMSGRDPDFDATTALDSSIPLLSTQCKRLGELLYYMHIFIVKEILQGKGFECKKCDQHATCPVVTKFIFDMV